MAVNNEYTTSLLRTQLPCQRCCYHRYNLWWTCGFFDWHVHRLRAKRQHHSAKRFLLKPFWVENNNNNLCIRFMRHFKWLKTEYFYRFRLGLLTDAAVLSQQHIKLLKWASFPPEPTKIYKDKVKLWDLVAGPGGQTFGRTLCNMGDSVKEAALCTASCLPADSDLFYQHMHRSTCCYVMWTQTPAIRLTLTSTAGVMLSALRRHNYAWRHTNEHAHSKRTHTRARTRVCRYLWTTWSRASRCAEQDCPRGYGRSPRRWPGSPSLWP